VLNRLASEYRETAWITAPAGIYAVPVGYAESPDRGLRVAVPRWQVTPMYIGAGGKVLLAYLDEAARELVVAHARTTRLPSGESVHVAGLYEELAAIRRNGYAVAHGAVEIAMTAVSVPILGRRGRPVASLSLIGPTARMGTMVDDVVPALVAGARTIARRIAAS
jgi:DNA-binding IclR family transcriptional regulator